MYPVIHTINVFINHLYINMSGNVFFKWQYNARKLDITIYMDHVKK